MGLDVQGLLYLLSFNLSCLPVSGILRLHQSDLLQLATIEDVGGFLGKLPSSLDSEILFRHIDSVQVTSKKFQQILQQEHSRDTSNR